MRVEGLALKRKRWVQSLERKKKVQEILVGKELRPGSIHPLSIHLFSIANVSTDLCWRSVGMTTVVVPADFASASGVSTISSLFSLDSSGEEGSRVDPKSYESESSFSVSSSLSELESDLLPEWLFLDFRLLPTRFAISKLVSETSMTPVPTTKS